MDKLTFQFGNAKLSSQIAFLNLPAGWACPNAKLCLSKFDPKLKKIVDGPDTEFRCFGAMSERYPSVANLRWNNFNLLRKAKTLKGMIELISASLPNSSYIRPHSDGGDFFNETYFLAWLNVAINNPDIVFYTYTKHPEYIVKFKNDIPSNFRLTASFGGKNDHLIEQHNLKFAKVFFSEDEAKQAGLEIDRDDSHANNGSTASFALLLHGAQPKKTLAAKAWQLLVKAGKGYSQKNKVKSNPQPKSTIIHVKK